ncbi:MAG: NTP transferase domain-containing protein [Candidatus Omnitrophica bacterium]|nr:NTP transferase domain-containing protein [Candidatus Omnitrophota bacterium]
MANNVIAIIQARMGASRLPNKMLLSLRGTPLIDWVIGRVSQAAKIDQVVVAIPDTADNQVLADHVRKQGGTVFLGSENDVVDRFAQAAQKVNATHIVRVCADNPFIAWECIDDLIDFYMYNPCDYVYNHIPRNNKFPDGLGAEMVARSVLERINSEAKMPAQREHVFNYIWDNPDKFSIKTFDPLNKFLWHPELKLDIDTAEDLGKLAKLNVSPDMDAEQIIKNILKGK